MVVPLLILVEVASRLRGHVHTIMRLWIETPLPREPSTVVVTSRVVTLGTKITRQVEEEAVEDPAVLANHQQLGQDTGPSMVRAQVESVS